VDVILSEIETWMKGKGYNHIDQFAGKMSCFETNTPDVYERMQFMKYYSQVETVIS